jgi:hypothetical protein
MRAVEVLPREPGRPLPDLWAHPRERTQWFPRIEKLGTLSEHEAAVVLREVAEIHLGPAGPHRALAPYRILRVWDSMNRPSCVVLGAHGAGTDPEARRCRAPELDHPEAVPTARSHVFTLACLVHPLVTGEPTFPDDERAEPRIDDLSEPLRTTVRQALAPEPALRPDTPGAFAAALVAATVPVNTTISNEPAPGPIPRWRRRANRVAVAAAAVAGVALGVTYLVTNQPDPPEPVVAPDAPVVAGPVALAAVGDTLYAAGAAGIVAVGPTGDAEPVPVPGRVVDIAASPARDALCVAVQTPDALVEVDPDTRDAADPVPAGGRPGVVAATERGCVATLPDDQALVVVDAPGAAPRQVPLPADGSPTDVAVAGDRAWVLLRDPNEVLLVDLASGAPLERFPLRPEGAPEQVLPVGTGAVVTDPPARGLWRVGEGEPDLVRTPGTVRGMTADPVRGGVWVAVRRPDGVVHVDANGRVGDPVPAGSLPEDVARAGPALWIISALDGAPVRVFP